MTRESLIDNIRKKASFLCIGLDADIKKIPQFLLDFEDPIFEFNKRIIDATKDLCVAYKPNIAFYESMGPTGWSSLQKTLDYIPADIFTIADAKRGDIGNTSNLYARTFFETYNFDSITVAPYMGEDSISPFLDYEDKWVILLALTSNAGSQDFQMLPQPNGDLLYQYVIRRSQKWKNKARLMYVTGATHPDKLKEIRKMIPNHFMLVPGVGAQGGSVSEVAKAAITDEVDLLINSSRSIIYAGQDENFADQARDAAGKLQIEMAAFL